MQRLARRKAYNSLFVGFCTLMAVISLLVLAAILWSLLANGLGGFKPEIFFQETPSAGSEGGGLANAIAGTVMMCVVAMVGAVIVGVLAGTWLAEYGKESPYAHLVRFMNDVLLSAPSILIGLFVYYIAVKPVHGFSGWAGALALGLIAAPVVARTTEDVLKLQSRAMRESGIALGAPVWHTIRAILWRSAAGGMLTGALLAFARVSGETAPLLFTALNNQFFEWNMSKAQANLPVVIFQFALSPDENWRRLAWAGALLIAGAVLTINILVRLLAPREAGR